MNLREKVRNAFNRPSNSKGLSFGLGHRKSKSTGTPIKIEYYKRHEVPPSKFKGPFDPEHQRRLAAWSFDGAMATRSRSIDLSLSPCTTLPESICPLDPGPVAQSPLVTATTTTMPMVAYDDDDLDEVDPCHVSISVFRDDNAADEAYAPDDRERSHSSSATAVDSSDSSFTGSSASTLQVDSIAFREDSIAQLKEAVRYTSPILRTKSPPPVGTPRSKRSKMMMPFAPEELARALNAVQLVCT